MRVIFLPIYLLLIIAFQLKAQVVMQQDAPALLQICVRDTSNTDPVNCTKQQILNIVISEINCLKFQEVKPTLPFNINLFINERGTITEITINKNNNAFANRISSLLQAKHSFFPARKNSSFIPSSLTYAIDQQALLEHNVLNQKENLIVTYQVEDLIPVPREEIVDILPFSIVDEPPTTKKCAKKTSRKEKQDCFSTMVNNHIDKHLRKKLKNHKEYSNQRIFIIFKINENGKIKDINTRPSNPYIKKEVEKIMNKLPKITPAKQRGKYITTQFSAVFKS
jgi:hypothetical protein